MINTSEPNVTTSHILIKTTDSLDYTIEIANLAAFECLLVSCATRKKT